MAHYMLLTLIVWKTLTVRVCSVVAISAESSELFDLHSSLGLCPEFGEKPESLDDDVAFLQSAMEVSSVEPGDGTVVDSQESEIEDLYGKEVQQLIDDFNGKQAQRLPDPDSQPSNVFAQLSDVLSDSALASATSQAANSRTVSDGVSSDAAEVMIRRQKVAGAKIGVSTQTTDWSLAREPVSAWIALQMSTTITSTPTIAVNTSAGPSAAEASGVSTNAEGDLEVFLVALLANSATIVMALIFFLVVRRPFAIVYEGLIIENVAPQMQVRQGMFDWAIKSRQVTVDQVQDSVGLDTAMLLVFCEMCMKIFGFLCVPLLCIEGPLNYVYGGHAARKDYLSYLSFGNVETGSWLYYVHSGIVWLVVFVVQWNIFTYMDLFMKQRFRWLHQLSASRARTVLVQDIPEEYQSDTALMAFFEKMFGEGTVKMASCVKVCPALTSALEEFNDATKALEKAQVKLSKGKGSQVEIREHQAAISKAEHKIQLERTKVEAKANTRDGICAASGFVTFYSRSDAEVAESAVYSPDVDDWQVSKAPPPAAIQWDALKTGSRARKFKAVLGYHLVAGLYVGYLPAVIYITQIANNVNMGLLQPLWGAFAPTLGLTIMVAMLPTFIISIFRFCFSLPDAAIAQEYLQNWYFVFQLVFVVLVTAIGGSIVEFMETIVTKPMDTFKLLGEAMPAATHFYMNFNVLQWVTHATNLTRIVNLIKYLIFKTMYDPATAKEMCEPEDQDYYGIGSRSARFTINACIGVVYGTLSPPITLLVLMNFLVCRLVYGYLCVFAETKKPDMGGSFFVYKLKHLFVGNAIYCITMTGVLVGRATSNVPGLVAAASLPYVLLSYARFKQKYNWEKLPLHEVSHKKEGIRSSWHFDESHDPDHSYVQPELVDKEGLNQADSPMHTGCCGSMLSEYHSTASAMPHNTNSAAVKK